jgi:hypothetical protein
MKRPAILVTVTVIALVVGVVAAASGAAAPTARTYTARVFMRGMKVTVPNRRWTIFEDHPGEFNLAAPAGPMGGTNIHFWLDPHATAPHGVLLRGVGRTPTALIRWLRQNPDFAVSAPTTRRIAGNLATKSVNLNLSATAPREDPSCPGPCLTYFVFNGPGYNFSYGTGRGEPVRLYFATIPSDRAKHTFTISIDAPSSKAFNAVIRTAEKILASVRLPRKVSAG